MRGVEARSFLYESSKGNLFIEDLTTGMDGARYLLLKASYTSSLRPHTLVA
jgi:hypothetical protein